MSSSTPTAPRPKAASPLKPTQAAQEFRWKFLKGQQLHATRLNEAAPEPDDGSLQWKEAGAFPCHWQSCFPLWRVLTCIQRIEASLRPRGLAAAVLSLMMIALSSEEP